MSNEPFGHRYVIVPDGRGQAKLEPIPEQVEVVNSIFEWIGREQCTLGENLSVLRFGQGTSQSFCASVREEAPDSWNQLWCYCPRRVGASAALLTFLS